MDWEEQLKKFELELPTSLRYQTTHMATARPYLSLQVCMLLNTRDDSWSNFQYQLMILEIIYHRMQLLVCEVCRFGAANIDDTPATIPIHPYNKGEGI